LEGFNTSGFDTTLRLPSYYGFLHLTQSLTLNSRVFYGARHVTPPAIRIGSNPVQSLLLFRAPTQLTGWNRSSRDLLGRRVSFSDRSDGVDLLSSSPILSTNPNLDDSLTVCSNFTQSSLFSIDKSFNMISKLKSFSSELCICF